MKQDIILLIIIVLSVFIFSVETVYCEENVIFTYEETLRDPFDNYNREEENGELTLEEMESLVPFNLEGILDNGTEKIALIRTEDKSLFITNNFRKEDFKITDIQEDRIIINYKSRTVYMEIGGDLVEE